MSQNRQVQLSEAKEWLNGETKPLFRPLQDKATNLMKETKARIDDALQSSQKILENSENEMNKNNTKTYRFARNANKFSQSLIEAINAVTIPTDSNYDAIHGFCSELEKALGLSEQLRRGAYPYISPYFIFDRRRLDVSLKRLYDITKELRDFLTTKYAKVKTVENAHTLVDRLHQTINETKQNQENIQINDEKLRTLDQKTAETNHKISQIEARAELNELLKANQRIDQLRENVKHNMRYLQKPFFKLQSLARTSEVTVPLDEMNKLGDYLSDPYTALATEQDGFSTLRNILTKLDATIAQGKLKLKTTRIRKAQDQISSILNRDSLGQLQKECKEALHQRKQLLTSETVTTLQNQLAKLQNELKELRKECELANSKSKALHDEQAKLRDRTEHLRKELEKNIFQTVNKNVQIDMRAT